MPEHKPLTDEEKESIAVSGWMQRDAEAISFTDEEIAELTRLWNNLFSVSDDSITTLTYKAHGPARRELLYAIHKDLPRLLAERVEDKKEIERLQAGLQQTKDGVYVVPGMTLYFIMPPYSDIYMRGPTRFIGFPFTTCRAGYTQEHDINTGYSTRDAAERAATDRKKDNEHS